MGACCTVKYQGAYWEGIRRSWQKGLTDLADVDSWINTVTNIHYNVCPKNLLQINFKTKRKKRKKKQQQ